VRRRVTAALLVIFAGALISGPAFAAPGGNGNGPPPRPTCGPNTQNPGGRPPCGNANGNPGYPPQPILQIDCLQIFGDIRLGAVPSVKLGGDISLLSPPGCLVGGQIIVLVVLSQRRVIGQATVLEDGSVRIQGTMPSQLEPGTHNLEVDIGGQTHAVRAISVVPSLDQTTLASHSTPRSGTGVALLALWALLILGGGAVLASFGWKRLRPAGTGGVGSHESAGPDEGPPVPRIDTSGFQSTRPSGAPGGTED
jgi:hypothetical protein